MTNMGNKTYRELFQFSSTVDIVDEFTYNEFRDEMCSHFRDILNAQVYEVFVDGARVQVNATGGKHVVPALQMIWTGGRLFNLPLNKSFQTSIAYEQDKPLWVVDIQKKRLSDKKAELEDKWSHLMDIPLYQTMNYSDIRTAIILPLRYGERVFGILNLEFIKYLECTPTAKIELEEYANSIARIVWLHETFKRQVADTRSAFGIISKSISKRFSPLEKPCVFVATPDPERSDMEVIGAINHVLGRFADRIEIVYWKNITNSGNVNFQILGEIVNSNYGICYFSEKAIDLSNPKFFDNPNVLFEAGMLHALCNDPKAHPQAWIPIRECASSCSTPPFDFASERILVVPRVKSMFNKDSFIAELEKRLEKLFHIHLQ